MALPFINGQIPTAGDFNALAVKSDLAAPSGASLVGYLPSGTGGVPTDLQSKTRERVSVFDFMTAAEIINVLGGTATIDVTAKILACINYCLATSKTAYAPRAAYLVSGVAIDNSVVSGWSVLSIEGESFETGSAMSQTGYGRGTTFVTSGTSAFLIALNNFSNESIRLKNISFYNRGAIVLTGAIVIDKTTTSYQRALSFEGIGYYNFDSCITLRGNDASILNNYFGPMTITKQFPYLCGIGLQLIDAYANLCHIDDSLYFGCSKGGIVCNAGTKALGSGGIFSVRNTHFEGCEPAGLLAGVLTTFFTLDNTSAEATGAISGYGIVKRSSTVGALTLAVSNSNYGTKGFSLMPSEYRLGRGDVITASCPVNASGYGWQTTSPQMVTPVVSNNVTYGQTDKSTFCMTPIHSNVGRMGQKVFAKFTGWSSGGGLNYSPPFSRLLPDGIRSNFVGAKTSPIYNVSDTYVAPSAGYIYTSWMGSYSAVDNGFAGGTDININGINVATIANSFGPYTGNFLLLAPIAAGNTLARCSLAESFAGAWITGAYTTFEPSLLTMAQGACGYPNKSGNVTSLATAASLVVEDYGDGATPYAVSVKLLFNDGAYGYIEYLVSGDGAVAANKSYAVVASRVVAGVSTTPANNTNPSMYYITVANTTGVTITVTKEVTYLS